mgnify:CR=1 FL=1
MKNSLTAKEKLNRLNKRAIVFSGLDIVITLWAIIGLLKAISSDDGCLTLSYVGLAIIAMIYSVVFASVVSRKRSLYTKELQEASARIVRGGIWSEIWDSYKHDGFEFCIQHDRLLYEETDENSIEYSFSVSKHEFILSVDEKIASIIADEEAEHPIEAEISLGSFSSVDSFYEYINSFVEKVCTDLNV